MAVTRERDPVDAVTSSYVTWARRYRALVKGGEIGLDANVDSIVTRASVSYEISLRSERCAYPFASLSPYTGVIARRALRLRSMERESIAGGALVEDSYWTLNLSNLTR